MASDDNRNRILLVQKILLDNTDPEHPITQARICELMERTYGVPINRKTVSSILNNLNTDWDLHIEHNRNGYYVASRVFSIPELKLLVDTVQTAKFLTEKKSRELIKKLEAQTSIYGSKELHREVVLMNRPKTDNEKTYEAVDSLHTAVNSDRQVEFQYTQWDIRKHLRAKYNGKVYRVSPWAMVMNDGNYYLIAYNPEHKDIRHYRVDKMINVHILDLSREGSQEFADFDLVGYSRSTFGMYRGPVRNVTFRCQRSAVGVIIDRFGREEMLIPEGKDHIRVTLPIAVSPQFFGWLTGLGEQISIIEPEDVKEEYLQFLQKIINDYHAEQFAPGSGHNR